MNSYTFSATTRVRNLDEFRAMIPKEGKHGGMIYVPGTDTDTTYMVDLVHNAIAYVRNYLAGGAGKLVIDMRDRTFLVQYSCIISTIIDSLVDDPAARQRCADQFAFVFITDIGTDTFNIYKK